MRRLTTIYTLILFIVIIFSNIGFAHPIGLDTASFVTNEILFKPTDKSVTIMVVPKKNFQIYFEYGTISSVYTNQSEIKNSTTSIPLRIDLLNLLPNTRYYYRIRYKESGSSQYIAGTEHTFITQRAKGSTFKFTIEADPHLYDKKGIPSMMNVTLQNQVNDSPDFMFDLGDTFGDDHNPTTITRQEMMQLHYNFLSYIGLVCHSAPFFFCLGNHEGERGYYLLQSPPENISVYGALARKYYYSNPVPDGFYTGNTSQEGYGMGSPENYYAWEWGDALFVVLDAYRYSLANEKPDGWDWTLGDTQYAWFARTLKNSSAKYKFVFAHHVRGEGRGAINLATYYEWGGNDSKGKWGFTDSRPGWELPIHQLMVKYGVNVFFQGHDHLYSKEVLDGIVYQEVPMPSDSTYQIGMLANADAYTGIQLDGTGHIRVTVSPTAVQVDYVRAYLPKDVNSTHKNGEVALSYQVKSSSTAINQEQEIPTSIQLEQNYPNPFNPSTEIKYSIATSGFVSLKVFDILGREVALLVNEYKQPGTYVSSFSTQNISSGGNIIPVSSGIYYYQLRQNKTILTKKAILIK